MVENYIEKLMKVRENIEEFLDLERRALDKFGKPPQDEQKFSRWREYTEPIARAITAYETSLGILKKHFPEIK